jgi:nitronate monooxygenase
MGMPRSELARQLRRDLEVPVAVAPMFLVSGPRLVIESCRAGLMGSFPTQNARTLDDLVGWLDEIRVGLADMPAPRWAVSMIVHRSYDRFEAERELIAEHRPDVVITALGSPVRVLDAVHGYGGAVFADVMSVDHARKAVAAGADGLVLVCHGAGGHTGGLSAFAFIDEVRKFFDGPLIVGGAISSGRGVLAAETLGADLAYMGTRFIACPETLVGDGYRDMLARAGVHDVIATAAVTGVMCSWLSESLAAAGFTDTTLAGTAGLTSPTFTASTSLEGHLRGRPGRRGDRPQRGGRRGRRGDHRRVHRGHPAPSSLGPRDEHACDEARCAEP